MVGVTRRSPMANSSSMGDARLKKRDGEHGVEEIMGHLQVAR
jgi:hypothetical protein